MNRITWFLLKKSWFQKLINCNLYFTEFSFVYFDNVNNKILTMEEAKSSLNCEAKIFKSKNFLTIDHFVDFLINNKISRQTIIAINQEYKESGNSVNIEFFLHEQ